MEEEYRYIGAMFLYIIEINLTVIQTRFYKLRSSSKGEAGTRSERPMFHSKGRGGL